MIEFNKIWVEKYRPTKLDDVILDEASLRVEIQCMIIINQTGMFSFSQNFVKKKIIKI